MNSVIVLENAYYWTCPRCHHGQFARAIDQDRDTVDSLVARDELELDDEDAAMLLEDTERTMIRETAPENITCSQCGLRDVPTCYRVSWRDEALRAAAVQEANTLRSQKYQGMA